MYDVVVATNEHRACHGRQAEHVLDERRARVAVLVAKPHEPPRARHRVVDVGAVVDLFRAADHVSGAQEGGLEGGHGGVCIHKCSECCLARWVANDLNQGLEHDEVYVLISGVCRVGKLDVREAICPMVIRDDELPANGTHSGLDDSGGDYLGIEGIVVLLPDHEPLFALRIPLGGGGIG